MLDDNNVMVVRLGGSVLYTDTGDINTVKLQKFIPLVREYIGNAGHKLVLLVGGGKLSREIVNKYAQLGLTDEYKHMIGMLATHINAEVLSAQFQMPVTYLPNTYDEGESIVHKFRESDDNLLILGGFQLGTSTDESACNVADMIGVQVVHKLSAVPYVYTRNPDKFADARPLSKLTWDEYLDVIGVDKKTVMAQSGSMPNMSVPVNLPAVRHSIERGYTFVLAGDGRLNSVESLVDLFSVGSIISPA